MVISFICVLSHVVHSSGCNRVVGLQQTGRNGMHVDTYCLNCSKITGGQGAGGRSRIGSWEARRRGGV